MPKTDFYKEAKIIDEALTSGGVTSVVIDLIREKPYNNYFFRRVTAIEWFSVLHNEGYFKPEKNPHPDPADQEGFYSIPEWNVLPYLERISQQINIAGNEKYIDELLTIIKEVSNYKNSNGQHIDNYRTWFYFVKILLNIPNEKTPLDIINLIPIWLDSKFDTILQGPEIATKLLPKFLDSDKSEDFKKAEKIVDTITAIKWFPQPEKQSSLSGKKEEAKTVIDPHWLMESFKKNAFKVGERCSANIIYKIANRIKETFEKKGYLKRSYDTIFNGQDYRITIISSPTIDKYEIIAEYLFPDGSDEYTSIDKRKTEHILQFNAERFESKPQFVTVIKEKFKGKDPFSKLTDEFDEALLALYPSVIIPDYSYIWFKSLNAPASEIYIHDADQVLVYILKEILLAKARCNVEETKKVLEKLLGKEYPYKIYRRLVLHIIGNVWNEYKEYFFNMIKDSEDYFDGSYYSPELSVLLKNNFNKFDPKEKEIIKNIIEAGPQLLLDENPEKYKAYWKQKWLSLMKDDPVFAPLFEEQRKLTGIEKEKFDFGSEVKVSDGFGQSPLSVEEILNLSSAELAVKLKEFRSEKKLEGMTVAALAGTLKEAVKVNQGKFTENLSSFKEVGFIYIYKILDGLKETWKEKKAIDWGKVFDFITPYIKTEQFWKDKYVVEPGAWLGGADHEWITGMVAELIQEGTSDDAWAISEDHFDKAKEIIFTLLRKPEEDKDIADYVTYTLNTPCGKLITALVYLALRIARINEKKGVKTDPRWSDVYREKFDEILVENIIEAYVSLGRFLPYLSYLDKEWVKGKIEQTISEKGTKYWQAFMEGYFSIGRVYDDIYELMKRHYEYGLSFDFKERHDREYLIQHICIGYLRDHAKLDDPESLFRKIIDDWKPDQIREVIGFFWMQRGILTESTQENEKMRGKIIEFWRLLYAKYKDKDDGSLTREDKQILSAVSKLATFLSKIESESFEWLMVSSPYVHEDFNSNFFIEYLDELKDKGDRSETAKYIGDIYRKMLEKITPDFDQEHIRSIVEFLYDAGATDSANRICNIYGARGQELLRDIYEKHSGRS